MKALVIGAGSQTGGALLRALERNGIETAATTFTRPLPEAQTLDVRVAGDVDRCIDALKPDVIFLSVIPRGGADYCETHPEETRALNVEGTRHVAVAAARQGSRIVYYSSDYIFDGKAGPYSEEDAPSPLNVYGRTKWEAEEILRAAGPRHLILRTTAVFGWDRTSPNFAMTLWGTLQSGNPLPVANDQWCNPTLVDFLAEVSVRLVQAGVQGTVNVVGKDRLLRSDWAAALARALGLNPALITPVSTRELARPAARPLSAGLRTDKLTKLTGTDPLDLSESLKRFRRQWRADTHVAQGPSAPSSAAEKLRGEILEKVREYHALAHRPAPFVPFKSRIQYAGRVFGPEEMMNLVDSSLDFWLTLGPYGERFEQTMKAFFGSRDFILVNSGSTANLTAVMTLMSEQLERRLRAGDEVITTAVTFPTTLAPLVHGGLLPVFVDCEIDTLNIDPNRVEAAVSEKTRALVIPHTLGNPCDMEALCDVARRHGLFLIEDSCDALGGTFQGRRVGTFGDLATLSFFPAHHITTGEGGGVVVNTPRLSRIARSVRDWGRDCWCAPGESNTCGKRFGWQLGDLPAGYDHKYIYSNIGYNFKPTDLQAAIGVAQAERIPEFVARRRDNFRRIYQGLRAYEDRLILPRLDPRMDPAWFGFPVTVKGGVSRRELVHWLESANIETRGVFSGNILRHPAYRNIACRIAGGLEVSDRVMNDTFFFGVYPGLTGEMIDFILKRFKDFFEGKR